jgi:hypothetical protein
MTSSKPYRQHFASHGTIMYLRQDETNRRPYKVPQQYLNTNKHVGLNGKSSGFYLGGLGFEIQTGHRLYWFVCFVVSLKKSRYIISNQTTCPSFNIFPIHSTVSHRKTTKKINLLREKTSLCIISPPQVSAILGRYEGASSSYKEMYTMTQHSMYILCL